MTLEAEWREFLVGLQMDKIWKDFKPSELDGLRAIFYSGALCALRLIVQRTESNNLLPEVIAMRSELVAYLLETVREDAT